MSDILTEYDFGQSELSGQFDTTAVTPTEDGFSVTLRYNDGRDVKATLTKQVRSARSHDGYGPALQIVSYCGHLDAPGYAICDEIAEDLVNCSGENGRVSIYHDWVEAVILRAAEFAVEAEG